MVTAGFSAVGADQVSAVHELFDGSRSTRHCSCMAFCSTGTQFAAGWFGGGNRRRFDRLAGSADAPMGILASVEGRPAAWCATGPRSRYTVALAGRSELLAGRPRSEDDSVWLIACVFVGADFRTAGLVVPLLRAAIDLAWANEASAVESWPLATGVRQPGLDHVGREAVFRRLGFSGIDRVGDRVTMRLQRADPTSVRPD
jgi:hypothetical protein